MNKIPAKLKTSLRKLINQRGNIDQIMVNDILADAQVGRSSFYRYYHDKYALLNSIVTDISHATFQFKRKPYPIQLKTGLELLQANQLLFQNAFKYHGQNSIEDFLQRQAVNYLYQLIFSYYSQRLANQYRFAANFYSYGLVGIIKEWILNGCQTKPATLAPLIIDQMPVQLKKIIFQETKM